jgi:3-oxoacyl-[acyl-carrier protein] reductase
MPNKDKQMKNLIGKTVLITGASRGIGEAAARMFALHGANVVLTARSKVAIEAIAAEIIIDGGSATALTCDVSKWADVEAAIRHTVERCGGLDILINNSGGIEPIARLADSDPDAWGQVVDVNYKGVYHGMRAALPVMLGQGKGTIISLSSGAATSALEGWSHYSSSKAAALMLTRCAHKEYAAYGIRALALSPGTVATDMQTAIRASGMNPVSKLDPSVHISTQWVGKALMWLTTSAADRFCGEEFSIKTEEGRRLVGLTREAELV